MGDVRRNPVKDAGQFPYRYGHWHPDLAQLSARDRGRRGATSESGRIRPLSSSCARKAGASRSSIPGCLVIPSKRSRIATSVSPALAARAARARMLHVRAGPRHCLGPLQHRIHLGEVDVTEQRGMTPPWGPLASRRLSGSASACAGSRRPGPAEPPSPAAGHARTLSKKAAKSRSVTRRIGILP
jgi:hypothetical protein